LELLAVIPGTEKDEEELHQKFATYRLAGEWFTLSDSIMDEIEAFGRYEAEVVKTCDSPELAPVVRRPSPGRPPKEQPAEVIRLVLSLDPIEHSDLIATFMASPARGRSAIAADMMDRGLARMNRKQEDAMSGAIGKEYHLTKDA